MELPAADDRDPARGSGGPVDRDALAHDIFAPRFLLKRPCCEALAPDDGARRCC
jgi:hypothetical protein